MFGDLSQSDQITIRVQSVGPSEFFFLGGGGGCNNGGGRSIREYNTVSQEAASSLHLGLWWDTAAHYAAMPDGCQIWNFDYRHLFCNIAVKLLSGTCKW